MGRSPLACLLAFAVVLAAVAATPAAPARAQTLAPDAGTAPTAPVTPPSNAVTVPGGRPLYLEGPDGRRLLDGPWLFRADPEDVGLAQRWHADRSTAGWAGTTVPSVWNVGGTTRDSFEGTVGWYRKDFRLPAKVAAAEWLVRFEAVNFRATVWLNGRRIGEHVGGHTPFELRLANVARRGVNRLVVRVDNRRAQPEGVRQPVPPTGWWNYGGIQREVYVRPVDRVDIAEVQVIPRLPRPRGPATITVNATVRNVTRSAQTVTLAGRFGRLPFALGERQVPARGRATFTGTVVVRRPRLWEPGSPNLYRVRLAASARGPHERSARQVAGYTLATGIRSLEVRGGQLALNGKTVRFRGVALHEDTLERGSAMTNADRVRAMRLVRDSGSTLLRAHYPLHPHIHELADRLGILIWSEIPSTYQLSDADLGQPAFRGLALAELRENVLANRNHVSVAMWSLGNEMASAPGRNQARYLRVGSELVRSLDPTRPVALAFAGHPETPCQEAYAPLDVLGMNDYFGWYTGYGGNIADRDNLAPFLDDLRRCYPTKAIAVTEFGAEANRSGPVEEKGTYEFQTEFVTFHLDVFASRPWLSGSVYWALQEFRIRNGWAGGNPWSEPPIHQKGLVRLDFSRKPAYAVLRRAHRAMRQYVPRRPASAPASRRAVARR